MKHRKMELLATMVLLFGTWVLAQIINPIETTALDGAGQSQQAGFYRTPKGFSEEFTFETREPFEARFERLGRSEVFGLTRGKSLSGNATHWFLVFALPKSVTPTEALETLRQMDSLNIDGEGQKTIGEETAIYLNASIKPDVAQTDPNVPAGSVAIPAIAQLLRMNAIEWYTESPQARLRFIVFQHRDRTFLIYIETPKDGFESFSSAADQVLASVKFAK